MAITADRGGVTANKWYETGIETSVEVFNRELKIRFDLDSKGGGKTDVRVNIEPQDFENLIAAMLDCDFKQTVNAFSRAIIRHKRI